MSHLTWITGAGGGSVSEAADLDTLFDQMRDPESAWMAAFTSRDPHDRQAFDAHMSRVRAAPEITQRAVTRDGRLVGSIASTPTSR
jgi:hypothetical protein